MLSTLLLFLLLPLTAQADGARDCKLNGKEVNPSYGPDFTGVSGIMKCTDSESGKTVFEQEYKNGQAKGHKMLIDFEGNKVVTSVNENGNKDGSLKKFNPSGKLLAEEHYRNGSNTGLNKYFSPNGKLQRLTWYENGDLTFKAEYNDDGKLSDLRCPTTKSFLPQDREICGFAGSPSRVELFDSRGKVYKTVAYLNGKITDMTKLNDKGNVSERQQISGERSKRTENYPDGKLKIEAEYKGRALDGDEKEFHSSGKLIRVSHWKEGQLIREETYFLNGKKKSQAERKNQGDKWLVARKTYGDNGKLMQDGVFVEMTEEFRWSGFLLNRWTYDMPVGQHNEYSVKGTPESIRNFNNQGQYDGVQKEFSGLGRLLVEEKYGAGKIQSRKIWSSSSGKLQTDEEYFEDGSKKNRLGGNAKADTKSGI